MTRTCGNCKYLNMFTMSCKKDDTVAGKNKSMAGTCGKFEALESEEPVKFNGGGHYCTPAALDGVDIDDKWPDKQIPWMIKWLEEKDA